MFNEDSEKLSTKGLSKRTNQIKFDAFLDVLNNRGNIQGKNIGFRSNNNHHLIKYYQSKFGISYFYIKRVTNPDHSTNTLDV